MEFTDELKGAYKKKLLDTFKDAIKFFDAHNLSWWAYAGTAIGAVRHHGLIPWDDDIDICMPYEDYCRLQTLNKELEQTALEIYKPFEGEYNLPYMKIANKNSSIIDIEESKFVGGVWVDIFPLYKTDASKEDYWKYVKKYGKYTKRLHEAKAHFMWSAIWHLLKGFHLRSLRDYLAGVTIYKLTYRKNLTLFTKLIDSIQKPEGKKYIYPFTYFHCLNLFPIEWFNSSYEMNFENFKVKMPVGYDAILKCLYGDYMTPPPIEKRISTHSFYFLDLERRYSYQEIKKIKKCQQHHG